MIDGTLAPHRGRQPCEASAHGASCSGSADEDHRINGPCGGDPGPPSDTLAVCRPCHLAIHSDPRWWR